MCGCRARGGGGLLNNKECVVKDGISPLRCGHHFFAVDHASRRYHGPRSNRIMGRVDVTNNK